MHLTHATDPLIDNERSKVLNDLNFTGCVDAAALITRSSSEAPDQQASTLQTDCKLAVLRVNECQKPTETLAALKSGLSGRTRAVQIWGALRSDLDPNQSRFSSLQHSSRYQEASTLQGKWVVVCAHCEPARRTDVFEGNMKTQWIRPPVLDATATSNTPNP